MPRFSFAAKELLRVGADEVDDPRAGMTASLEVLGSYVAYLPDELREAGQMLVDDGLAVRRQIFAGSLTPSEWSEMARRVGQRWLDLQGLNIE